MNAQKHWASLGISRHFLFVALALLSVLACLAAPGFAASNELILRLQDVPTLYHAVGTIRPRVDATIMAQASGRIKTLSIRPGDHVSKTELVATVEDSLLLLRLSQARSGVRAAQAQRLQAEYTKMSAIAALTGARAEFDRVTNMEKKGAATPQKLEQVTTAFKQASSAVNGAEQAIVAAREAVQSAKEGVGDVKVGLGYTKVTAPFDGIVTRGFVEPGDLAWPGRPLFHLMDPSAMRLEAHVREGLVGKF